MAGKVVDATMKVLFDHGPHILRGVYWEDHPGKGKEPCYLPRLQAAAGPHKSGEDAHVAGRALDIILFANRPGEKEVADNLVEAFLKVRAKLQFIAVVYNLNEWTRYGQKIPHTRKNDEHFTHIHIEWSADMMGHSGFEGDLADAVRFIDGFPTSEVSGGAAKKTGPVHGPVKTP